LNHYTSPDFWHLFEQLPEEVQELARKNYELLKADPHHPSLHFKKVGEYWSVRVGRGYRALGTDVSDGLLWGWIGSHAEYDRIIS
jgi:hypothetical protein